MTTNLQVPYEQPVTIFDEVDEADLLKHRLHVAENRATLEADLLKSEIQFLKDIMWDAQFELGGGNSTADKLCIALGHDRYCKSMVQKGGKCDCGGIK